MAKTIMNSRQAAFAKRSHSFIDRGVVPRHVPAHSSPLTSAALSSPIAISDWGSPDGKLDWGIKGDKLNKLRKSATFNFRCNGTNNFGGMALPTKAPPSDEPDLTWVHHLVKDGPPAMALPPTCRIGLEQQKQYQRNGGGAGDFLSWDQLYSEQDRMQ